MGSQVHDAEELTVLVTGFGVCILNTPNPEFFSSYHRVIHDEFGH